MWDSYDAEILGSSTKKNPSIKLNYSQINHPSFLKKQAFDSLTNQNRCILCVRDPRAFITSLVFYMDKHCKNPTDITRKSNIPIWEKLSLNQKFQAVINMDRRKIPFKIEYVAMDWKRAKTIHKKKNVLVVKYENLCGEKGGGSEEMQRKEIKKILRFINYKYDKETIDFLVDNLWGTQYYKEGAPQIKNFRKGKIDDWKNYFTPELNRLFYIRWSSEMSVFGYK